MNIPARYSKLILPILAIAIFLAIALLLLETVNAQKIVLGTKIGNINFGGLNVSEAEIKLADVSRDFFLIELAFEVNEENMTIKAVPSDMGISLDKDATLKEAFSAGRKGNIISDGFYKLSGIFIARELKPRLAVDEERFQDFFRKNFGKLEDSAQNAALAYDKKTKKFQEISARRGIVIDKDKFRADVLEQLALIVPGTINVAMVADLPQVEDGETEKAKIRAEKLLENAPFVLTHEEGKFTLNGDDIVNFLDFVPAPGDMNGNMILGVRINNDNIRDYLIGLAPGLASDPRDAKFEMKSGKVIAFALSQPGRRLDIEKNIEAISNSIWAGEKNIPLVFESIRPKITESDIEAFGINSLMGKGVSNFSGSPKNRVHNIKVGTNKFQGILIGPREEFSFNKNLGTIGPAEGYLEELVIKQNKTIPEYGGGLCQVSTTLFRAAVNAGLQITERFPHAFPVKYYDPQGFDATIYPPHPDLRFINNTDSHILLQTKIERSQLTFEIYGKDDGRKVEIEGPREYDKKADGSMKAKLTQKVYDKDGELMLEKTFYSNYKSPALYPVDRNPLE